uniref:Uncharacterized protein n=1 Tax=Arundo donax TaxID=35708 RepID=A0A0A9F0L1_ARUDO
MSPGEGVLLAVSLAFWDYCSYCSADCDFVWLIARIYFELWGNLARFGSSGHLQVL